MAIQGEDIPDDRELESLFDELALAYDETLAGGDPSFGDTALTFLPDHLHTRWRNLQACLQNLHAMGQQGTKSGVSPSTNSNPNSSVANSGIGAFDRAGCPQSIGRFAVLREIGRGGFGLVLLARDPLLDRVVALKIPHPEVLVTGELRKRFIVEARAAGALQHANLATVYEADEQGPLCYIASAYCPGPTLAAWLKAQSGPVPIADAVQLVQAVAEGVEHAHSRGVLHRDIKPGNILLEPRADQALTSVAEHRPLVAYVPKLTDFGLAKLVDGQDQTLTGTRLGTPAYMAPEQLESKKHRMGRYTDVYGLGVILYELLTRQVPFEGSFDADTLRQVLLSEPQPPRTLRADVPRDLQAVVLKCLEKDPARRYRSAGALADDLQRFLEGVPTHARPLHAAGAFLKWARRQPALAALLAVGVLGPAMVAVVLSQLNYQLSAALEDAKGQRRVASERADSIANHLYVSQMKLAWEAYRANDAPAMRMILAPYQQDAKLNEHCGLEFSYLWGLCHAEQKTLLGHVGDVYFACYSPDGASLATGGKDRAVRLWDARTGAPLHEFRGHDGEVNCVAFSPDGQQIASASDDQSIRIWSVALRKQLAVLESGGSQFVTCVRFTPDGKQLISGDQHGVVSFWDMSSWKLLDAVPRHAGRIEGMDISSDGRLLATVSENYESNVKLWDLQTRTDAVKIGGHVGAHVKGVAFNPSGSQLITGDVLARMFSWDTTNGRQVGENRAPRIVQSLAFDRATNLLAVGGDYKQIELFAWPARAAHVRSGLCGHANGIWCVTFSPNGRQMATASRDGAVKLWGTDRLPAYDWITMPTDRQRPINVAIDGAFCIGEQGLWRINDKALDGPIVQRSLDLGEPDQSLDLAADGSPATALAVSPDKRTLAVGHFDQRVRIYDVHQQRFMEVLDPLAGVARQMQFAPQDSLLVAMTDRHAVYAWDTQDWRPLTAAIDSERTQIEVLDGNRKRAVFGLLRTEIPDSPQEFWITARTAVDPRGKWRAQNTGNAIEITDVSTGQRSRQLNGLGVLTGISNVGLTFAPDGKTLITWPAPVTFWNVETGLELFHVDMPAGMRDVWYDAPRQSLVGWNRTGDGAVHILRLPIPGDQP